MCSSMIRRVAPMGLLGGIVVLGSACVIPTQHVQTVAVQPAPVVYQQPAPVATTYTPQYYRGNVVYFDTSGFPFYYLNGAVTSVPRSCTCYQVYVDHYRTYRSSYLQWYTTEGSRLISIGLNLGL